jgi:hypothetical protein
MKKIKFVLPIAISLISIYFFYNIYGAQVSFIDISLINIIATFPLALIITLLSIFRFKHILIVSNKFSYSHNFAFLQVFTQFLGNFLPSFLSQGFIRLFLLAKLNSIPFGAAGSLVVVDIVIATLPFFFVILFFFSVLTSFIYYIIVFIIIILVNKYLIKAFIISTFSSSLICLNYFIYFFMVNIPMSSIFSITESLYVGNFVSSIPLSIGGLGVRELVSNYYFEKFSVNLLDDHTSYIVSSSLTIFFVNAISQGLLSLFFYIKSK